MLNSCLGKGIVDCLCKDDDDGIQYFSTVSYSPEFESAREESVQFWRQQDWNVILVSSHSSEYWRTGVL